MNATPIRMYHGKSEDWVRRCAEDDNAQGFIPDACRAQVAKWDAEDRDDGRTLAVELCDLARGLEVWQGQPHATVADFPLTMERSICEMRRAADYIAELEAENQRLRAHMQNAANALRVNLSGGTDE